MGIRENLTQVEERIARACQSCGRRREEITLVAVSKVFSAEALIEAYEAGLREFGENYVQEFEAKHPLVKHLEGARFHLIGHLQSNKSKKAAEIFDVVQTVDSAKLARRLNECGKALDVMIEVKLSGEEAKHGCAPEAVAEVVEAIRACDRLTLRGLMTMPPWDDNAEAARPYFRHLRELGVRLGVPPGLSMGMSHDFETAIQEGATHIRVGTALFGKRVKRAA